MLTKKELQLLQTIELNILKVFHDFCLENNLKYYLIGGALLGAVRYKGFIPWDDDVDVAMPRDDYEKFQIAWSKKVNEDYFLQSNKTDSLFSRCILKLRKNRTRIIEKTTKNLKMHEGIYIDIFPIDFVEEYDQKKLDNRAKKIKRLMTLRTIRAGYNSKRYNFFKKLIRVCTFFISLKKIDEQIDKLCTKDNKKEHKYAVLFLHNYEWNKQFHEISIFGEGKEIDFCGYKINAPVDHNAFLTKVFGDDYIKEPREKRQPHNYELVEFGDGK